MVKLIIDARVLGKSKYKEIDSKDFSASRDLKPGGTYDFIYSVKGKKIPFGKEGIEALEVEELVGSLEDILNVELAHIMTSGQLRRNLTKFKEIEYNDYFGEVGSLGEMG